MVRAQPQEVPITFRTKKTTRHKALKRLHTLRAIYGKPDALRQRFGLKRRKLSPSQKLVRLLGAR